MNSHMSYTGAKRQPLLFITSILGLVCAVVATTAIAGAPPPNEKCDVAQTFTSDPAAFSATEGDLVTLTQNVDVSALGSGSQDCGLLIGDPVDDGNAKIAAVQWAGEPRVCADLGESFCSTGLEGASCTTDEDCDTDELSDDGTCTEVALVDLEHENPFDGEQSTDPAIDTAGLGGTTLGFAATYQGQGNYESAPRICTDLTVLADEVCEGALISIDRASGPGEPTAPGGPYDWTYRVTVHACEDLYGVSAQGGTNGWAQLVNRSAASLHPSAGVAEIRNPNKKTDVILWTIGDMTAGQEETLVVDLRGSLKGAPDCDERFLSGPWSALFSVDGFITEKSDYTGRVSIFTNSNGVTGDCN